MSDKLNDAKQNTDREIYRVQEGDYYADSIHVTEGGGIRFNCGGTVIVMPLRKWHEIANAHMEKVAARPEGGALEECTIKRDALHLVVSALAGKLMLENETLIGMLTQAEEELRAKRWLS